MTVSRYSRDSAWFGLTRWRELMAQFFDPCDDDRTHSLIDSVAIEADVPGAGNPELAPPPPLAGRLAGGAAPVAAPGTARAVRGRAPPRSKGRVARSSSRS